MWVAHRDRYLTDERRRLREGAARVRIALIDVAGRVHITVRLLEAGDYPVVRRLTELFNLIHRLHHAPVAPPTHTPVTRKPNWLPITLLFIVSGTPLDGR